MKPDLVAERSVLSSIYNGGNEVYYDVADVIQQSNTFTNRDNEYFYLCLKHAFEKNNVQKPDLATMHSAAKDLGLPVGDGFSVFVESISSLKSDPSNARRLSAKIRKLKVANLLADQLEVAQNELGEISGSETVSAILSIAESKIFDFSALLNNIDTEPASMADGAVELLQERIENPVEQVGLSTGFGKFDNCIGGGLRPSTVSVIAARTKGFKSGLALNVGMHVSSLDVPVLYVDTELTKEEQTFRMFACMSEIHIEKIETGKVRNDEKELAKLRQALREREKIEKFEHKNVVGMSFEDQISMMRRWLFKVPGINFDGKANPCLIIFDYIKLMDSAGMKDMAEYQKIGFMVSTLHNFAVKYNVPILTFIQLNRDGIVREDSSTISQSDRVAWFCSNISIFKPKSKEEVQAEEELGIFDAGNFKLVPLHCRHGKGIDSGDYVNMKIVGEHFKVTEGNLHSENLLSLNSPDETEDDSSLEF